MKKLILPQLLSAIPANWDDPVINATEAARLLALPGYLLLAAAEATKEGCGGHLLGVALRGGVADIVTLYVPPLLRRQGVARRLLAAFLTEAEAQGALGLTLEVRADNAAALALYAKCGLTPVARRVGYYAGDVGAAADALVLSTYFR